MSVETESPVESIRNVNRQQVDQLRKENRYKATTIQRGGLDQLQSRNFTPTDVQSMAITLRKKKGVDRKLLTELSQALATSKDNASAFSKVDGALQALCSYLTGGDSTLQLEATYCAANLALWEDDDKSSSPTASVTGAYLITFLGSNNSSLQEACCWALCNMFPQGKSVLSAQGFLGNLVDLLGSPYVNVRTAAAQCLVQFVTVSSPLAPDLTLVANGTLKLLDNQDSDPVSTSWLFYTLSCYECCDVILDRTSAWSLHRLHQEVAGEKNVLITVPLVRLLANACAASDQFVISCLKEKDFLSMIVELLNSSYEPICKETCLLVANCVNKASSDIQALLDCCNFRGALEKPLSRVSVLF